MTTPYDEYNGTPDWIAVEHAIQDLAANRDLVETTRREYVVRYICSKLQGTAEPERELK